MLKNTPLEGEKGPGTVVGVNVALTGTLKDQNDIVIYGMVEGEVISEKSVSVGESAQVKGPIRGRVINVAGTVRGSIEAMEQLEISSTGKIFGGITTKNLVVQSGATIIGKVAMASDEEVEVEKSQDAPATEAEMPAAPPKELKPDEE